MGFWGKAGKFVTVVKRQIGNGITHDSRLTSHEIATN